MRDEATLNQLLVLANMESYNAILIEQGKPQSDYDEEGEEICGSWNIPALWIFDVSGNWQLISIKEHP